MHELPAHLRPPKGRELASLVLTRWGQAPVTKTAAHALAVNCLEFLDAETFVRCAPAGVLPQSPVLLLAISTANRLYLVSQTPGINHARSVGPVSSQLLRRGSPESLADGEHAAWKSQQATGDTLRARRGCQQVLAANAASLLSFWYWNRA